MGSTDDAVSRLCTECGMCCDGSLFSIVELGLEEDAPMGPTFFDTKGVRRFAQPCPCFDSVCTIYDARPRTCRVFLCDTARAVQSGRLGLRQAQERIGQMRQQVALLRGMSEDPSKPAAALVRGIVDDYRARRQDPSYSEEDRARARAAFAYRKLKRRYFVARHKRYLRSLRRAMTRLWSGRGGVDA